MPDLSFQVDGIEADPQAAAPTLVLKLRIVNAGQEQIHSILLRCQIDIEATRRRYDEGQRERLFDLFGPPRDWGRTLGNFRWTEISVNVPGFTESTLVDLPLPCTYDFNVAATRYFDALEEGEVPLCLLFSGTVFYATAHNPMQVAQIPWNNEAKFRLPVGTWREMMDRYYPNCVWLALSRDVFGRLEEYKRRSASPTWERALETLLDQASAVEDVI